MTIIKYMTFLIPYSTCIVSRRGAVSGRGLGGGWRPSIKRRKKNGGNILLGSPLSPPPLAVLPRRFSRLRRQELLRGGGRERNTSINTRIK